MLELLTLLLAAAAVAPLWRTPAIGLPIRLLLSGLALAVATLTFLGDPAPLPPHDRPLEAPSDDYVGSATCRACHPHEHATWHGSFHRTMTQAASRAALVARFDRLELDWFDAPVVLEWRGDQLWTEFRRRGARPADVARPVVQVTGSHHLQVLWYSTGAGRELAPVPLCYHIGERRWLPIPAVFVLPPGHRDPPEPGAWNRSCHACHTTDARPRLDAGRTDTMVGEFGIACEACHGPGREHVAANRDPLHRFLQRGDHSDPTIVDPADLPPVRSAQVCGQCHSVSIVRERHASTWRDEGSPFRPGRELDASHLVVDLDDARSPELRRELQANPHVLESSFWPDGEVRLSGREFNGLRRSPCYTHGDPARQLDCTSCHRMHHDRGDDAAAWRDDQLAADRHGNAACTQCHAEFAEPAALAAHTHHAPGTGGSACYDCHMPHTSFGLMKASRSHTITSPSVAVELRTRRPNACNLCHLDRSLQWTDAALQARWGTAPAPLADDDLRDVAAGVRWLLTGDAAQRAIAGWSFGWSEARAAAGTDWMAPFLARLLDDPYYVVRFQALRALRGTPGADAAALAAYDFLAEAEVARGTGLTVTEAWRRLPPGPPRPPLLLDEHGLQDTAFARLFARRDDRPVYLAE